jgi:serine/threonine-protein kinase
MGFVFGANDVRTGTQVAIKIVNKPEVSQSVLRLQHEARLVVSLRHPNICSVFDVGWLESIGPYLVMERLYGESLSHRLATAGPQPLDWSLDVMLDVLSALDAAHGAKVVHRDIKPGNIFISGREGMPPITKVLDFGSARKLEHEALRLTNPGIVIGTPVYMCPEVLRGGDVDFSADLFSWGATLFEMLTGELPFPGTSTDMVQLAIMRGERRSLRDYRPEAPRSLSAILDWTLSPRPFDRPRSARELYQELRRITRSEPPRLVWVEEQTESTERVGLGPTQTMAEISEMKPLRIEEEKSSSG